jgi:hypothetical protein
MKNEETEADLAQVIELLEDLRIKQRDIENQINEVSKIAKNLRGQSNNKRTNNKEKEKLFPNHTFRLGDRVKIINPKHHQLDTGVIDGVTPSGFVRIITEEGDIIRRIPENIRKIA